jgi:predicted AAA+ superfamily ATPase
MESKPYIPRRVEEYAFDGTLPGRHMAFLAGPKQVGKTMLAKEWLHLYPSLGFKEVEKRRRALRLGN